jgi:hypothetical protein
MTQPHRALILLFVSASSAFAAGDDLSKVDLRPLLQIHARRVTTGDPASPFPIPITPRSFDETLFISKGGGTIWVVAEQPGLSGDSGDKTLIPFRARIVRGIPPKADLAALKTELSTAKIAQRTTCSLSGVVEAQHETTGPYEISWYGQGNRRNSFAVEFFGKGDTPSHPLCPQSVPRLLGAIANFLFRVEEEPGSEILESLAQ